MTISVILMLLGLLGLLGLVLCQSDISCAVLTLRLSCFSGHDCYSMV